MISPYKETLVVFLCENIQNIIKFGDNSHLFEFLEFYT